ncbi:hypothetical protein PtrSN002B_011496 [Pyrenophora tritici-repentis]|nr:hypothetical protein PtrV1_06951 [Pyrenophora tritici-repentis]KAF7448000.1 hypothetical protein A1F99_073640 [Pyrenophora tritici-repentis]KAF7571709.1 hypothetical protein PtrM4_092090 [Pyrenophora tritici-repentis]KAG9385080.1 hypothetical protein A1F94_004627 [Pyrenophora tritici-repentis]KAI0569309.1 hypothetical protein Alg215_11716 [Pyrenophora tritici-repentis]
MKLTITLLLTTLAAMALAVPDPAPMSPVSASELTSALDKRECSCSTCDDFFKKCLRDKRCWIVPSCSYTCSVDTCRLSDCCKSQCGYKNYC